MWIAVVGDGSKTAGGERPNQVPPACRSRPARMSGSLRPEGQRLGWAGEKLIPVGGENQVVIRVGAVGEEDETHGRFIRRLGQEERRSGHPADHPEDDRRRQAPDGELVILVDHDFMGPLASSFLVTCGQSQFIDRQQDMLPSFGIDIGRLDLDAVMIDFRFCRDKPGQRQGEDLRHLTGIGSEILEAVEFPGCRQRVRRSLPVGSPSYQVCRLS